MSQTHDMDCNVAIISVVRDFSMYERCVSGNRFCSLCRKLPVDNRKENLPVPVLYNKAAEGLLDEGYGGWMVFCHEDWQAGSDIAAALEKLDKGALYGVIGVDIERHPIADVLVVKGNVRQCSRDGVPGENVCGRDSEGPVGTFDCQCLIVHSSLFASSGLRFDENLRFDMYVEDFCAAAAERFGIPSCVIPLECTHFSPGKTSRGFRQALKYVRNKYAGAKGRYASIAGHLSCFGAGKGKLTIKWKKRFSVVFSIIMRMRRPLPGHQD